MSLPVVAIVGRPNVGKSSLFNALCRHPIAIVDQTPGTTRDRVEVTMRHANRRFRLTDTGGIGIIDRADLAADVEHQIELAIKEASVIVFVTDVRDGVTPLDREVAERLRALGKPVLPVVNKCDSGALESQAGAFWALGFGPPLVVSAVAGFGCTDLLDRVVAELPDVPAEKEEPPGIKIAVIGRRNVGKSTLINRLVGEDRLITSPIPGTTRDAVDVPVTSGGRRFIAIDTAGAHRMTRVFENVEFFSRVRLERSIRRADVVLFLIDASVEVGTVEKKLASTVAEAYRPVIIVVNKWDLTRERDIDPERYVKYIGDRLPGLDFAPISFISAKDGFNVEATMELAEKLFQQSHTRVPTARLNEVVHEAVTRRSPPRRGNRQPNIFYATQVNVAPPTVVIFVSDDSLFSRSYVNYLQNALRAALPFDEVPVKVELRSRERSPAKFRRGPRPESPIPYQHRGPRKKRKR